MLCDECAAHIGVWWNQVEADNSGEPPPPWRLSSVAHWAVSQKLEMQRSVWFTLTWWAHAVHGEVGSNSLDSSDGGTSTSVRVGEVSVSGSKPVTDSRYTRRCIDTTQAWFESGGGPWGRVTPS